MTKLTKTLLRFFHKPVVKYIAIYIALILIFAGLFSLFEDQFYHSYLEYEPYTEELYNEIKTELQKSIADNFYDEYNHHSVFLDEQETWLINIEDVMLNHFFFNDEGNIICEISMYIYELESINHTTETTTVSQVYDKITLEENGIGSYINDSSKWLQIIYFDKTIDGIKFFDLGFDNSKIFYTQGLVNKIGIKLDSNLIDKLQVYQKCLLGKSDGMNGSFWRMLYLSMISITTLGFGDIVPLTNITRFLIGLESVLGIIVLGAFVSSLMGRRKI